MSLLSAVTYYLNSKLLRVEGLNRREHSRSLVSSLCQQTCLTVRFLVPKWLFIKTSEVFFIVMTFSGTYFIFMVAFDDEGRTYSFEPSYCLPNVTLT